MTIDAYLQAMKERFVTDLIVSRFAVNTFLFPSPGIYAM